VELSNGSVYTFLSIFPYSFEYSCLNWWKLSPASLLHCSQTERKLCLAGPGHDCGMTPIEMAGYVGRKRRRRNHEWSLLHGFTILLGMRNEALCFRATGENGSGKGREDLPVIL
jgi:hypothetical protein